MSSQHHPAQVCEPCTFEPFVRNNYFTGKMMGAAEFIAETRYHQDKLRMHQVRLHGWGVVCGLDVVEHGSEACRKRYVIVRPGSAVDCCGYDILVEDDEVLDLLDYKGVVDLNRENPAKLHTLGICVRFEECTTETVPVLYDDCGCNDDGCAPNRILESYAFDVIVDPPLGTDLRLAAGDVVGGLFHRPPDAALTGPTPRIGTAALADNKLYALDPKRPKTLVVYDLHTRHTYSIDLGATAYDVAAQGNILFVATAPAGSAMGPAIQVFKPGAATSDIVDTGLSPTEVLQIGSSVTPGTPAGLVVAYPATSKKLLAFADDGSGGLKLPPTDLGSMAKGVNGFVLSPDGNLAAATDGSVVEVATLAPFASKTLTALSGAKPSSLAFTADSMLLAVADTVAGQLHLIDPVADTLRATVPLDHPPMLVAAGDGSLVAVIEEEAGLAYLQLIDASAAPPLLASARLIDGTDERLVILGKGGAAGVAANFDEAGIPCDELIWHQICCPCTTANCVMLATIHGYVADASVLDADTPPPAGAVARIDNRDGRKVLASTGTLQAWLECLELKGVVGRDGKDGVGLPGSDGADGLGLNPDLPKIIDIGWSFEEPIDVNEFYDANLPIGLEIVNGNDPVPLILAMIKRKKPLLIVYFNATMEGVTRQTFGASICAPLLTEGDRGVPAVYDPTNLRPYGTVVEIVSPPNTPHTNEPAVHAVCFVPNPTFFQEFDGSISPYWKLVVERAAINIKSKKKIDPPLLTAWLKGDFVYAKGGPTEDGILDANNIAGKVGDGSYTRSPPIHGGQNPSGDLAQGGLFESWFWLTGRWKDREEPNRILNEAPADDIVRSTNVSKALARRIVAARGAGPLKGLDDLAKRIRLSNTDLTKLRAAFEPK